MLTAGENVQQLVLSSTSVSTHFYSHWQKELDINVKYLIIYDLEVLLLSLNSVRICFRMCRQECLSNIICNSPKLKRTQTCN